MGVFDKNRIQRVKKVVSNATLNENISEIVKDARPVEIEIDLIENPPFHDRTYIDVVSLDELSKNIEKFGIIEPIVVRKKDDGGYQRISGYRRIEAVKKLGWKKIPAVVLDVDEETALALMLSENIHRDDLSDYDKVSAIVQFIDYTLGISEDEIKKRFQRIFNVNSDRVKKDLSEDEIEFIKQIDEIVKMFKVRSWKTFSVMIRLLNVHPLIRDAIRRYGWKYTVALEVNKLRDNEEHLKDLIEKIVENDWGITDVRNYVAKIKGEEKVESFPFKSFTKTIQKNWKKLPENVREEIDKKLKEIEELVKNYSK